MLSHNLQDQVLLRMQEKLDNLCEQVNYLKDQPENATDKYDCQLCQQHKHEQINLVVILLSLILFGLKVNVV